MLAATKFSQTGGARLRETGFSFGYGATWPFAKLTVSEDEVELATGFGCYSFPPRSIVSLREHSRLFFRALRIEHTIPAYPAYILFWSFDLLSLIHISEPTRPY